MRVITRGELPALVWQLKDLMEGRRSPRDRDEANFRAYHFKNPHVYQMFSDLAATAIAAGKSQCSAWHIVSGMRWEAYITAKDDNTKFTICNNYIGLYARLWMERNTAYHDWFTTKLRDVEIDIVRDMHAEVEPRAKARRAAAKAVLAA